MTYPQQLYQPYPNAYQNPYQPVQNQQSMLQAPQPITQTTPQQTAPTVQNGDFYVVPNEDAVLRWPVAPGNLVTFKIENQPVLIEKSMGYSKFDSPHYDRFKLVREEMVQTEEKPEPVAVDDGKITALEEQIQALSSEFNTLKEQVSALETKKNGRPKKEDADE